MNFCNIILTITSYNLPCELIEFGGVDGTTLEGRLLVKPIKDDRGVPKTLRSNENPNILTFYAYDNDC